MARFLTGRFRRGLLLALVLVGPLAATTGGAATASPITAQVAEPDTAAVPAVPDVGSEPDTLSAPAEPVVSPAAPDTVTTPRRTMQPREDEQAPVWWTTVRSGILPGWGQLANGKPVKAAILAGIYAGWATGALMAESDRRDLEDELAASGGSDPALEAEINDAVDRRNFRMWMMGATMIYAMIDAYVDAHFKGYDEMWSAGFTPEEPGFAVSVRF